ncbi:MAG: hypothetical protein H6706_17740 [Myxococcales bacterium]|nr:hypothetical protein [Myxococcales bacterium]
MKPGTARALLVAACAAWIATGLGRAALDAFLGIPRDFGDIEAVERWRSWVTLLSWVSLAGTVAAVAGLIRLAFGGGTAAVAAAIGVVGMALVSATWMLLPVLDLDTGGLERFHTILPWLQLAVWALANVAMLATLWRFQARGPAFLVTSVLIGVGLAVWLLGLLDVLTPEAEQAMHPWFRAQSIATHVGLGWLWLRAQPPAPAVRAPGRGLGNPAAGQALRHFHDMLIARVVVMVIAIGLTFAARGGQDPSAMKAVLYGGTLLGMALGFAMMLALFRFAAATPAGDGPARLAGTMLALSLVLDLWSLKLMSDLFGGRLSAAFSALDTLPWVQGTGQVLGLIGMLGVVGAVTDVGRLAEDEDLVRRASGLRVGLIVLALLAFAVRIVASGRRPPVGLLLPLAVITLVGAIAVLVGVTRLVSAAAIRLDAHEA